MSGHHFALYIPEIVSSDDYRITDQTLVHRITRVLRLSVHSSVTLFNRENHVQGTLTAMTKKEVVIACEQITPNSIYQPHITFLLPVLKRDAFEAAIYFLIEAGVQTIKPIITQKTDRKWGGEKEQERIERISIAAAEQSKNFAFPVLPEPITLHDALAHNRSDHTVFFDSMGEPLKTVVQNLQAEQSITLVIGPEGDLTDQEKTLLKEHDVLFSRLTPTILRAREAAGVAACIVRSLV